MRSANTGMSCHACVINLMLLGGLRRQVGPKRLSAEQRLVRETSLPSLDIEHVTRLSSISVRHLTQHGRRVHTFIVYYTVPTEATLQKLILRLLYAVKLDIR